MTASVGRLKVAQRHVSLARRTLSKIVGVSLKARGRLAWKRSTGLGPTTPKYILKIGCTCRMRHTNSTARPTLIIHVKDRISKKGDVDSTHRLHCRIKHSIQCGTSGMLPNLRRTAHSRSGHFDRSQCRSSCCGAGTRSANEAEE